MELKQDTTRTLVAIHGWSGALLGLLLYAIVLTGTVAVFSDEIGHWSVGAARAGVPLDVVLNKNQQTSVQSTIDELAMEVDPEYRVDVGLGQTATGMLQVFFHKHQTNAEGQIEEIGTQFSVNPDNGEVISRQDGTGAELFRGDQDLALSRFVVDVHTELHLPRPWGLILTGILGLAMMIAAISGFLIHRHFFKEMFTLRRSNKTLSLKDGHALAGSWGLLFAFLLAFTGSFFSFAGSIGIPLMAMVGFGGDQEAMLEAMISPGLPEDTRRVDPASLDAILLEAHGQTATLPRFVGIEHYGRGDAAVTLFMPAAEDGLTESTRLYSGATGEFLGVKPTIGQQPSLGSQLFDLIGPLHFGHFAGLLSKAVWFGLGFAMCYLTLTGMYLWLERRMHTSWRRVTKSVVTFAHGLPIALAGSAAAFFTSHGLADTTLWTPSGFLFTSALVVALAWLTPSEALKPRLMLLAGVSLLLLPPIRMLTGHIGWGEALATGQALTVSVDLIMLIGGGLYLDAWRRARKPVVSETSVVVQS